MVSRQIVTPPLSPRLCTHEFKAPIGALRALDHLFRGEIWAESLQVHRLVCLECLPDQANLNSWFEHQPACAHSGCVGIVGARLVVIQLCIHLGVLPLSYLERGAYRDIEGT